MAKVITMSKEAAEVQREMDDLYREHKGRTIRLDYRKNTGTISVDGREILAFGNLGRLLCYLAGGSETSKVDTLFARYKARYVS